MRGMDREDHSCILPTLAMHRPSVRQHLTLAAVALRLTYLLVPDVAANSLLDWSCHLCATRPQRGRMGLRAMRASGRLRHLVILPYQLVRQATTRVSPRSTSRAATLMPTLVERLPCLRSAMAARASSPCPAPRPCSDRVGLAPPLTAGRPHERLRHRPLNHIRPMQHSYNTTPITTKTPTTPQQ